jgi:hypothetical protein
MRVLQTMWAYTAMLHWITRQNKNLVDLSSISKQNQGKDYPVAELSSSTDVSVFPLASGQYFQYLHDLSNDP